MNSWVRRVVDDVKAGLPAPVKSAGASALIWRNRLRGYGYSVGVRVPINRTLLSYDYEYRIATARNQTEEFKGAHGAVRPGDVVLELGGGLGVISAALRRRTAVSRIISFEANPDLLTYAKLTHQLNGVSNIEVLHGAVLSRSEAPTVSFYRHPYVSAGSVLHTAHSLDRIEVPVVKLQELLAQLVPNLLIVDIEGAELDLFEGAESLGSVDRISLELHPQIYGSGGVLGVFRALCRLGFAYDTDLSNGINVVLHRI
jgi:FkbM family methyltransferase